MNDQKKVHDLLAGSKSESANIDKLHVLFYKREFSDYDESLDYYLQKENQKSNNKNIIEKIAGKFSLTSDEERRDGSEEQSSLENQMFSDFINKIGDNIDGNQIHYIFRAELGLETTSKEELPSIKSELWENKSLIGSTKKIQEKGHYILNFGNYARLIITNEELVLFTLDCKIPNITKDSEWVLATEISFEDIEEVVYYGERSSKVTITTENYKLSGLFMTAEPQSETKSAIDYIGNKAELEPRLELSGNMDYHLFHSIKDEMFKRKSQVQQWKLYPENEKGVAWGIERKLDISNTSESKRAHEEATKRSPPVDIGDVEKMGIIDLTTHHRKGPEAVCEVEGFKIFVQNIPSSLEIGDVLSAKIVSYGRDKTSAKAVFIDTYEND